MKIKLKDLQLDGGTRVRAELNQIAVCEYADAMRDGGAFPPIDIRKVGDGLLVVDGFHRVAAKRRLGAGEIDGTVKKSTLAQAVLAAVRANREHGLRRTNADKREAVKALLAIPEHAERSDRWVAAEAGVEHHLVGPLRKELELGNSPSSPRKGADGKVRKMPAARARMAPDAPPPLEPRALELVRGTDLADDRGQLAQLARLPKDMQVAAARHIGTGDAATVDEARRIIRTGKRRDNDAYYTPDSLALALCERLRVMLPRRPARILEPSSGGGAFLRAAQSVWPEAELVAIDIDATARKAAEACGAKFTVADFLTWKPIDGKGFDLIVGNPEYLRAQEHVEHGRKLLDPGGLLAFLLSVQFLASDERAELNAGPGRSLAQVIPRPSFTGDGGTHMTEYGLFTWERDSAEPSRLGDPIRWVRTNATASETAA